MAVGKLDIRPVLLAAGPGSRHKDSRLVGDYWERPVADGRAAVVGVVGMCLDYDRSEVAR